VLAIGALGMASFALVDATKVWSGGISNHGFAFIRDAVRQFLPEADAAAEGAPGKVVRMLRAHWINGSALADQKAIAKSLLKLQLAPGTAAQYAAVTGVDPAALAEVARAMVTGEPLGTTQSNALGRFDLALTALLDEAYQRADQKYRNFAKLYAAVVAMALAVFGGWAVSSAAGRDFPGVDIAISLVCGLLAIPLAPVSKDLASALQAGVKVAQSVRK
jgi:hypothetical protein